MKVRLVKGAFGRWVVVAAEKPDFAWSGSAFVGHQAGIPLSGAQVSNFETEDDALKYALSFGFTIALPLDRCPSCGGEHKDNRPTFTPRGPLIRPCYDDWHFD